METNCSRCGMTTGLFSIDANAWKCVVAPGNDHYYQTGSMPSEAVVHEDELMSLWHVLRGSVACMFPRFKRMEMIVRPGGGLLLRHVYWYVRHICMKSQRKKAHA